MSETQQAQPQAKHSAPEHMAEREEGAPGGLLPAVTGMFDFIPRTWAEAKEFASEMAKSDMVPKDYQGKPANILIAMQWGNELGLKPLQSMQNIAPINGRPALWGDAVIALVIASTVCEYVDETFEEATMTATCRAKRVGKPEQTRTFSKADASTAGLWDKAGPWKNYPKRMLQMRARSYALRDLFADVLRGLPVLEEERDRAAIQGEASTIGSSPGRDPSGISRVSEPYSEAKFQKMLGAWEMAMIDGGSVDDLIEKAKTRHQHFTDGQLRELRAIEVRVRKLQDTATAADAKGGASDASA